MAEISVPLARSDAVTQSVQRLGSGVGSIGKRLLRGLQLGLLVMFRPGTGFEEIKEDTHFLYILLPLVLYFLSDAAGLYLTGFVFQTQDPSQVDLSLEALRLVAPWITWCVAGYAISSIFFGEATFQQVVVASAACLTPQFFFAIPSILFSNIFALDQAGFYYFLVGLAAAWTLLLFFLQIKSLNDFTFGRTILVVILSLFAMVVIWVTIAVIYVLTNQVVSFGKDLIYEYQTLTQH